MAENIVDSLFGPSPWQVQQVRNAEQQKYAAQLANMGNLQQAKFGIAQGAGQLAQAGAGMMGMVDPAVAQSQRREAVMASGGDLSTSAGLKAKAAQFAAAGDQQTAMKLVIAARKMEQDEAEMRLKAAHAKYYEQGGRSSATSGNAQLTAKQAIARNDAMKMGFAAGLSGQDLLDFADAAVQKVTDTWVSTSGVELPEQKPTSLSPMTQTAIVGNVTQEQKDMMIADAESRGDTVAAEKIKAMPVAAPAAPLKSKAQVAGDVKLAETVAANNPQALAAGTAAKKGGELATESNEKFYQQAESASAVLPKLDRLEKEIESSTFRPGAFADFRVAIEKAQSLLGGKDAAKTASDAEILNALMGQEVFSLLGAMGLGSKQMDTPAEREFMRQVLAGTVTMERGALKRLAQIRKADAQSTIDRYNRKVDSGELDNFLTNTNRQKKKFETRPMTLEERLAKYPGGK